jgi:hypothetical protein
MVGVEHEGGPCPCKQRAGSEGRHHIRASNRKAKSAQARHGLPVANRAALDVMRKRRQRLSIFSLSVIANLAMQVTLYGD